MYLPKVVRIKPQSRTDAATAEVVRRVRALDPAIPIVQMETNSIQYPSRSSPLDRWRERKETLVLTRRSVPFLTTFASPGRIVERLGVIVNVCWQCPYDCQFCYLQNVLPADHVIYTNFEDLERELAAEQFAYPAILALWSTISFARRQPLLKVPSNFHRVANYIRSEFLAEGIRDHKQAVKLLVTILHRRRAPVYEMLIEGEVSGGDDLAFTAKDLRIDHGKAGEYYNKNRTYPIRLNASEFTDLMAYDHLSGYSKKLVELVGRCPEIELGIRTKSSYVDDLVASDGCGRVGFGMNFNTPFVIEQYEAGTASLDDRLAAARRVQEAHGFRLRVAIEPILRYPEYERDYVQLVRRIMTTLDPDRIEEIAMGCVRYSGRLEARVKRNFPSTDLFDDSQELLPLVKHDRRRYPIQERTEIYRTLHREIRRYTDCLVRLGAETADAWDSLGWDRHVLMRKSVHQFMENRRRRVRGPPLTVLAESNGGKLESSTVASDGPIQRAVAADATSNVLPVTTRIKQTSLFAEVKYG